MTPSLAPAQGTRPKPKKPKGRPVSVGEVVTLTTNQRCIVAGRIGKDTYCREIAGTELFPVTGIYLQ